MVRNASSSLAVNVANTGVRLGQSSSSSTCLPATRYMGLHAAFWIKLILLTGRLRVTVTDGEDDSNHAIRQITRNRSNLHLMERTRPGEHRTGTCRMLWLNLIPGTRGSPRTRLISLNPCVVDLLNRVINLNLCSVTDLTLLLRDRVSVPFLLRNEHSPAEVFSLHRRKVGQLGTTAPRGSRSTIQHLRHLRSDSRFGHTLRGRVGDVVRVRVKRRASLISVIRPDLSLRRLRVDSLGVASEPCHLVSLLDRWGLHVAGRYPSIMRDSGQSVKLSFLSLLFRDVQYVK